MAHVQGCICRLKVCGLCVAVRKCLPSTFFKRQPVWQGVAARLAGPLGRHYKHPSFIAASWHSWHSNDLTDGFLPVFLSVVFASLFSSQGSVHPDYFEMQTSTRTQKASPQTSTHLSRGFRRLCWSPRCKSCPLMLNYPLTVYAQFDVEAAEMGMSRWST